MREAAIGDLVSVRAYGEADVPKLFEAVSESIAEVSRYETWCHRGYTLEDAAEYVGWWREAWPRGTAYYFAVEERETGQFVGSCGISDVMMAHKRAGLGFWIRSSRTGRGLATDAARVVARLAFEDLGLQRIELEIATDNCASRRVAEKLGCAFEGVLRRRLILPAGPTDMAMYAWLKEG